MVCGRTVGTILPYIYSEQKIARARRAILRLDRSGGIQVPASDSDENPKVLDPEIFRGKRLIHKFWGRNSEIIQMQGKNSDRSLFFATQN